jgi:hypothetical protein
MSIKNKTFEKGKKIKNSAIEGTLQPFYHAFYFCKYRGIIF